MTRHIALAAVVLMLTSCGTVQVSKGLARRPPERNCAQLNVPIYVRTPAEADSSPHATSPDAPQGSGSCDASPRICIQFRKYYYDNGETAHLVLMGLPAAMPGQASPSAGRRLRFEIDGRRYALTRFELAPEPCGLPSCIPQHEVSAFVGSPDFFATLTLAETVRVSVPTPAGALSLEFNAEDLQGCRTFADALMSINMGIELRDESSQVISRHVETKPGAQEAVAVMIKREAPEE